MYEEKELFEHPNNFCFNSIDLAQQIQLRVNQFK